MTTLGVIVPCRNEAAVIGRKLRNLAVCEWPASTRPHRIVVVDDRSVDATTERARAELAAFAPARVSVEVTDNGVRRGKTGAIEQGLRALGDTVDVIVLTDADVVLHPQAPVALGLAFERDARLGMACGAQRFVESLSDGGEPRALCGHRLRRSDTLYDRVTALVRAVESRAGLLFSVHGQLMAWRRDLDLHPTAGIAADDLDLMLQVRVRRLRIERIAEARFLEVRPPRGEERERQSIRRARAYVQFLQHPRLRELTRTGPWFARTHAWLYLQPDRGMLPWTMVVLFVALVVSSYAGWMKWGWIVPLVAGLVSAPFGLMLWRIHRRIALARFMEACWPMRDRWETARR